MTARDFLKELPVYSKIFDLSIDYQYTEEQLILFAEMYHKKQVKTLNIDDVSNRRELLIAFFKYFRDNGETNIGMSIEQFVDAFLAHNNR